MVALAPTAPVWARHMLPPPEWPANRPFPPTLEEACAILSRRGAGRGRALSSSYKAGRAGALPKATPAKIGLYPGRWLIYACALAATDEPGALMESYSLLRRLAQLKKTRAGVRSQAAVNAAIVLGRSNAMPLLALARGAVNDAMDFCDLPPEEIRRAVLGLHESVQAIQRPEPVAWLGSALEGQGAALRARLARLPAGGLEGGWAGLRGVLASYGVAAPATAPLPDPIRLSHSHRPGRLEAHALPPPDAR